MEPLTTAIASIATLLAALGGYWLAGRNEERRDLRASARARDERSQDRQVADARARHAMQLESLIDLQDALQAFARDSMRIVHHDHMRARGGKFTMLPEGFSDDVEASRTNVRRLMSRILNDALRKGVADFVSSLSAITRDPRVHYRDRAGAVLTGDDLELAADALYARTSDLASTLMDRVGAALRRELSWSADG